MDQLDQLIRESEEIVELATAVAGQRPQDDWPRLHAAVERRLEAYTEARGAIAQAHAVAGLRDREASLLTGRARLVLHRYVRHFAGQSRRTRDPGRLEEMIDDLQVLWKLLDPLMKRLQVPSVAEEVHAVGQFIGFFEAERAQLREAWHSGSRLEQSEGLGVVIANLHLDWNTLVVPTPRHARRLGLLDRLIGSLDLALETLMALRHANMPEAHEERLALASRLLVAWQDERQKTLDVQQEIQTSEDELREMGRALYQTWREQVTGERANRDRQWLAVLCDRTEEIERLLTLRQPERADPELLWLRDVLVAMERSYDSVVAAQQE